VAHYRDFISPNRSLLPNGGVLLGTTGAGDEAHRSKKSNVGGRNQWHLQGKGFGDHRKCWLLVGQLGEKGGGIYEKRRFREGWDDDKGAPGDRPKGQTARALRGPGAGDWDPPEFATVVPSEGPRRKNLKSLKGEVRSEGG